MGSLKSNQKSVGSILHNNDRLGGKMSNSNCNKNVMVEKLTLGDGRRAEQHVTYNADGDEIVEVFAEESRPLKLEERIVRKHKTIVAEERIEKVRDGEVVHVETKSREPVVPLQVVERIGVADHAKIVDGDYVRKEEIVGLVSDAVVAGMCAVMENYEPAPVQEVHHHHHANETETESPAPIFKAQAAVEEHVAEKKKNDGTINAIMAGIVVVQIIFFAYMLLFVL
jgi:hypothetical protein